jgi:hypothetical protein
MIKLRPATQEDVIKFARDKLYLSIQAWVYEEDGVVIGMGGLILSKLPIVFLEIKDVNLPKRTIWRAIQEGLKNIGDRGTLYAIRNTEKPSSKRLLTKLGFDFKCFLDDKEIWGTK